MRFMKLAFPISGTGLPGAGESQVVSEAKSSWWVKVNFIYFDSKFWLQLSKTPVEPVSCFMSHLQIAKYTNSKKIQYTSRLGFLS